MEKKKVIALEKGFKNRKLHLEGDIFEVNKNESASWYKDIDKEEVKPKRQYRKNKGVNQ